LLSEIETGVSGLPPDGRKVSDLPTWTNCPGYAHVRAQPIKNLIAGGAKAVTHME